MIQVRRHQVDRHGRRVKPSEEWFCRAREATNSAMAKSLAGVSQQFHRYIYSDNEVKIALARLFSEKCAYCEYKPTPSSDWDVDHFRPKGRVRENPDHPGYYWLAYEWTNLYMSCQHCNQWRRTRLEWNDSRKESSGGKADQFPLSNEDTRAMSPTDDIRNEDRLLIDPCNDSPERYIGYDLRGKILALDDNLHASTTIRVLNLCRRSLTEARYKRLQEFISFVIALEFVNSTSCRNKLKRRLVASYMANDAPFAAISRYVVQRPKAFGIDPDLAKEITEESLELSKSCENYIRGGITHDEYR